MPYIEIAVAAATALKDYDMIASSSIAKQIQRSNKSRRLKQIGLVGSAALGDCQVGIYFGSDKICTLMPTRVGAVYPDKLDRFWVSDQRPIKPGVPLKAIVEDAPTTNPIVLCLDVT